MADIDTVAALADELLLQVLQPVEFGLWKTKPLDVGVSEKSMVTPCSSVQLSSGRNNLRPL